MKNTTGYAGTDALGFPVERSSNISLLFDRLRLFAQIFLATLREIFDESAYARFLNQKQLLSSRAAYAAFRRENEAAKARRPKCC